MEKIQYDVMNCECSAKTGGNVRSVFLAVAEKILQRRKGDGVESIDDGGNENDDGDDNVDEAPKKAQIDREDERAPLVDFNKINVHQPQGAEGKPWWKCCVIL